jgi:hypothetical protein
MRKTPFTPFNFFSACSIVAIISALIIFQTSCSSNVKSYGNTLPATDSFQIANMWVELDIQFKAGCSPDVANNTLDQIEKVLRDTAAAMRNGNYPNFKPIMKIDKNLFAPYPLAHITMGSALKDTTVSPPTCKCLNNCGVCKTFNSFVHDTSSTANYCLASVTFRNE